MKRLFIPITSTLVLFLAVSSVRAQVSEGNTSFGAQLSLGENVDLGLGGRIGFSLEQLVEKLQGAVTLNYFFPERNRSYWGLNVNALYPLRLEGSKTISPYAGAGLGLSHSDVDSNSPTVRDYSKTKLNLNLIAGTLFGNGESLTPFAELRIPIGGFDDIGFFVTGGLWF